jgi:hypothetical protein
VGSYVVSLLVISTKPASYHFTLLILPMAIMSSVLIQQKRFFALALLAVLYFGHVFRFGRSSSARTGHFWRCPRLWLAITFYLCCLALLWQQQRTTGEHRPSQWVWSGMLASLMALEVGASIHHQHGASARSVERLPTRTAVILAMQLNPSHTATPSSSYRCRPMDTKLATVASRESVQIAVVLTNLQ